MTALTPSSARALRVALGLSAGDLAERLELRAIDVLRCEDGDRSPRGGWAEWERELMDELARWVAREGRPWSEIWPAPCEAARLKAAAMAARRRAA